MCQSAHAEELGKYISLVQVNERPTQTDKSTCFNKIRTNEWVPISCNSNAHWTGPRGSTPQSSNCTATYHPSSQKLSKLDEPDMQDIAGEVGTNS